MRELTVAESDMVNGGTLAYDLGHALGDAIQEAGYSFKWHVMNYAYTGHWNP